MECIDQKTFMTKMYSFFSRTEQAGTQHISEDGVAKTNTPSPEKTSTHLLLSVFIYLFRSAVRDSCRSPPRRSVR
jgi:hypothetical protein